MRNELNIITLSNIKQEDIAIPTADFNTDAVNVEGYKYWMVFVNRTVLDGTVSYTVEGSADGTNWIRVCPLVYSTRGEASRTQDFYPLAGSTPYRITIGTGNLDKNSWVAERENMVNFIRLAFTISGSPTGNYTLSVLKKKG